VKGTAGFVIPRLDNKAYLIIEQGDHFGHLDLAADPSFIEQAQYNHKVPSMVSQSYMSLPSPHYLRPTTLNGLLRSFTAQAFCLCELLLLSVSDLFRMKLEFPRHFDDLFKYAANGYNKDLMLKIQVIKQNTLVQAEHSGNTA
jgi:hypothetical protein